MKYLWTIDILFVYLCISHTSDPCTLVELIEINKLVCFMKKPMDHLVYFCISPTSDQSALVESIECQQTSMLGEIPSHVTNVPW